MSKEAMKLALEALEHCKDVIVERGLNGSPEFAKKWGLTLPLERSEKAITALREALAAPVQDEAWQAQQKANADYAIKCATDVLEEMTAQQQQDPVAVRAAIVVNLVEGTTDDEGLARESLLELERSLNAALTGR